MSEKNRLNTILYILKRILVNLKEPTIDKNDPQFLEYLCKELAHVGYELHEMALDEGDEWRAIRIFDEVVKPFEELEEVFKSLAEKQGD